MGQQDGQHIIGGSLVKGFCENPKCHLSLLFLPAAQQKARVRDGLGIRDIERHAVMKPNKSIIMLCDACKNAVDMVDVKLAIMKGVTG